MAVIQSGASTDLLTVDPTSKALRATLYDASGNVIIAANRGAVTETASSELLAGKDYKSSLILRASPHGGFLFGGEETILLADNFEGTTRDLNQWIESVVSMNSAQTTAVGLTINNGASVTAGNSILERSHKQFILNSRGGLIFRTHLRALGANSCATEWGFSDQTSAASNGVANGAFFRRDQAGSLQPVLAFNGTETQGAVMNGPATTDYAWYEIFLEESRATFTVLSHAGSILSSQVMEIGSSNGGAGVTTQARMFAVTHIAAVFHVATLNSNATVAPQIIVNQCTVLSVDQMVQRPHVVAQSSMGLNFLTSPTLHTQLANYANSAAPASATLSNTAAGYTTLGGQWQFAAVAGAETDYALFAWTNPTPYTFYCTGIDIGEALNTVVAVATTATVLQWSAAFNSSAVSLATSAPYTPMRITLGTQTFAVGAAVGNTAPGFDWDPGTPLAVFPGRFLHIILKMPIATGTATEIFRGTVAVDGFFE